MVVDYNSSAGRGIINSSASPQTLFTTYPDELYATCKRFMLVITSMPHCLSADDVVSPPTSLRLVDSSTTTLTVEWKVSIGEHGLKHSLPLNLWV